MTVTNVYVGKRLSKAAKEIHDQYITRMNRWITVQSIAVAPSRFSDTKQVVKDESERILAVISPTAYVVALDEHGIQYDSLSFSNNFNQWRAQQRPLVFIIGGAYGFDATVQARSDKIWSLSKLVFPHELARILLVEQLYRALSIEHGLPYHHA